MAEGNIQMTPDVFLFWFLAVVTLVSGLSVVLMKNPIYSALSLAMTMVTIAALFVSLNAYFIAGVQLIVYAGAVMVLFVMVLMLFDLKQEGAAFASGRYKSLLKLLSVGAFAGLIVGAVVFSSGSLATSSEKAKPIGSMSADATRELGVLLFTKYIFVFEALGVLLLVIAVGTVALAHSKGGTHAAE
jgi:NADH-quinone oxidoreductase subunit J